MCTDCLKSNVLDYVNIAKSTANLDVYESYAAALVEVNEKLAKAGLIDYIVPVPLFKNGTPSDMFGSYENKRRIIERLTSATPRSQKATGINALKDHVGKVPTFYLLQSPEDVEYGFALLREKVGNNQKLFCRPCPTRPRHGFVDSRPVSTVEEVRDMMQATLEADPEGEIILMPAINASYNAIWRPGLLAFGPGNDGATSGHGSRSVPLVPVELSNIWGYNQAFNNAAIAPGDVGYIEAVLEMTDDNDDGYGGKWRRYLTQMRGGPAMNSAKPDFIPSLVSVSNVVIAEGDLLEWETKAKNFTPGTVVYHPGGSLASHYAVHCVLNNVPIFITTEPKVGDVIEPNVDKVPLDSQAAVRGVAAGTAFELKRTQAATAVKAMLTGLHNTAVFEAGDAFYIGAAAAIMIRLGIAASAGEARHAGAGAHKTFGSTRDQVYTKALKDLFGSRDLMDKAYDAFVNRPWRGGYGGEAWANCTKAVADLDEAVRLMMGDPSESTLKSVVSALNIAINCAHNNGWWMNKFTDSEAMDKAANGVPDVFIDAVPVLAQLNDVPEDVIETMHAAWLSAKQNETVSMKPKIIKLSVAKIKIKSNYFSGQNTQYVHMLVKLVNKKYQSCNLPLAFMAKANEHEAHLARPKVSGTYKYDYGYTKLTVSNKTGKATLKFADGCTLCVIDTGNKTAFDDQLYTFSYKLADDLKAIHKAKKEEEIAKKAPAATFQNKGPLPLVVDGNTNLAGFKIAWVGTSTATISKDGYKGKYVAKSNVFGYELVEVLESPKPQSKCFKQFVYTYEDWPLGFNIIGNHVRIHNGLCAQKRDEVATYKWVGDQRQNKENGPYWEMVSVQEALPDSYHALTKPLPEGANPEWYVYAKVTKVTKGMQVKYYEFDTASKTFIAIPTWQAQSIKSSQLLSNN